MPYPFNDIEKKWQKYWKDHKTFKVTEDENYSPEKRAYILDMFPYPSGAGLHVGHPEGYTATDIYCRYLRMNGFAVLHPMGFDSFGLPAENYAIKTGTHPRITTKENIDTFRKQIQASAFPTTGIASLRPRMWTITAGLSGYFCSCIKEA